MLKVNKCVYIEKEKYFLLQKCSCYFTVSNHQSVSLRTLALFSQYSHNTLEGFRFSNNIMNQSARSDLVSYHNIDNPHNLAGLHQRLSVTLASRQKHSK